MNLGARALLFGAALAVASLAACAGGRIDTTETLPNVSDSGQLRLHVELPAGVQVTSVRWAITGGPHGLAGAAQGQSGGVPVGDVQSIELFVGGIPAGTDYAITVSAVDGRHVCSGPITGSSKFAIAAGAVSSASVVLACTMQGDAAVGADAAVETPVVDAALGQDGVSWSGVKIDAGVVVIDAAVCPEITAFSISPAELYVGASGHLSVTAVGPAAVIAWTQSGTGHGTFSSPASANPTFRCDTPGTLSATVTLTVPGNPACTGLLYTTLSATISCLPAPASGSGSSGGSSGSSSSSGGSSSGSADGGRGQFTPCTKAPCNSAATGGNNVPCAGQPGGVCTATEAKFVQHDIDVNGATNAVPPSCYTCLDTGFILDNPTTGVTGQECQDLPLLKNPVTGLPNTVTDCDNCLALIDSIFAPPPPAGGPNCASIQAVTCYCGTSDVVTSCQTGAANGVALASYVTAANGATPAQIVAQFANTTAPWGNASSLFISAGSVPCTTCLTTGN